MERVRFALFVGAASALLMAAMSPSVAKADAHGAQLRMDLVTAR